MEPDSAVTDAVLAATINHCMFSFTTKCFSWSYEFTYNSFQQANSALFRVDNHITDWPTRWGTGMSK